MCNCSNFEGNDPFLNIPNVEYENFGDEVMTSGGVDRHANEFVNNEDISFENADGSYGDIDDLDADTFEDFAEGIDTFGGYDNDEDFDNFDADEDLTDEDFENSDGDGLDYGSDFEDEAFKGGSGYEKIGSDSHHSANGVNEIDDYEYFNFSGADGDDGDDLDYEIGEAMDTFVDDDYDNADAEDLDEEDFDDQDFENADGDDDLDAYSIEAMDLGYNAAGEPISLGIHTPKDRFVNYGDDLDEEDFDDQDFENAEGNPLDWGVAESFEGDDMETIGTESHHAFEGEVEGGDGEFDDFLTKRSRARRKLRKKYRKSGMSRKEARKKAVAKVPKQKLGRLLKNAITFKTDPETTKIIKGLEKKGVISTKKDGIDKVADQINEAVNENVDEGTQNMGTETPTTTTGGTTQQQAGGGKGKMMKMVMIGVGVIVLGFVAYKVIKR
jgi:hypothetical protein